MKIKFASIIGVVIALVAAGFSLGVSSVPTVSVATAATAAKAPFYYGVWLPFWQSQSGASDIAVNLSSLHEVSPFSYELGTGGTIIDDLKIGNGSWDGWFSAVRDAGVKIIPTIAWFNGNGIYDLLSRASTRQAEEDKIAALAKSENFDGIDIDFESMTPTNKALLLAFHTGARHAATSAEARAHLHSRPTHARELALRLNPVAPRPICRRLRCAQ